MRPVRRVLVSLVDSLLLLSLAGCTTSPLLADSGAPSRTDGAAFAADRLGAERSDGQPAKPECRSFYGIAWRGTAAENLAYARQMGHDCLFYQEGMENDPHAAGLSYFIESPELTLLDRPQELDVGGTYTAQEAASYEAIACWRSLAPFPQNMATGWPRNDHQYTIVFDYQQQAVIDHLVDIAITKVKTLRAKNPAFRFAGFAWDEANTHGEFFSHAHSRNRSSYDLGTLLGMVSQAMADLVLAGDSETLALLAPDKLTPALSLAAQSGDFSPFEELLYHPIVGKVVHYAIPLVDAKASFHVPVSYWTGTESCLLHAGTTHQHATFTDGILAYYKTLLARARAELEPDVRWIVEPYNLYVQWVKGIASRSDRALLLPDVVSQESKGTQFVDDVRIFNTGYLTRDRVGSSQPDTSSEETNRLIAAKAALNGSWFNWYGRFGGSKNGDMPNYQSVQEVPDRLKLIRVVPSWDNLAGVPLADRSWDGTTYRSPNSLASPRVIGSRHPKSRKLFIVFLAADARFSLAPGEKVVAVQRTSPLLLEDGDGSADVAVGEGAVSPTATAVLGKAYILTLAPPQP